MVIEGKIIASKIEEDIREEAQKLKPVVGGVIIGQGEATEYYMQSLQRVGQKLGIEVQIFKVDDYKNDNSVDLIKDLNNRVDGIIIGKPLPADIDEDELINAILPSRDIDCIHPVNLGLLFLGRPLFSPCTPLAVIEILKYTGTNISGKNIVIVGRSGIVGRPLAIMLSQKGVDATVTICHTRTQKLKEHTLRADILVSAAGKPHLITSDMVKEGTVVIDVGTNVKDGKLVGDVDFDNVKEKAGFITPVPGGVGVVTTRILLKNAIKAKNLKTML